MVAMCSHGAWFNKVGSYRCLRNTKGQEVSWRLSQNRCKVEEHHQIENIFIFSMRKYMFITEELKYFWKKMKKTSNLTSSPGENPLTLLLQSASPSLSLLSAILFYTFKHTIWTRSFFFHIKMTSSFLYYYNIISFYWLASTEWIYCNLFNHLPALGQVGCLYCFLLLLSVRLWRTSWHIRGVFFSPLYLQLIP